MPDPQPAADSNQRILVVDDDPHTAEVVRDWFRNKPLEVLRAGDGETGLRMVGECHPHLILLDVRMPGLDGIEVARRLKEDPATMGIPILLLTACRDVNTKVTAFAVGADDYLTKPFEVAELDARIQVLLRKREMMSGLQSQVRDLTATNQQMEQLLMVDEKTGLYNFREFQRRLREEWQRARRYQDPLSLVFFDIDHFKMLNDTLGHQAGDRALQEFATLVTGGARANDVAARYGGEEFAVIVLRADRTMALRVAERIQSAVREFVFLEDESPTRITVSAGVATYPSPQRIESVDDLVRAADTALYRAKDAGRDCVVQFDAAAGD